MMVKFSKLDINWDAQPLSDGCQPWEEVALVWVNPDHVTNCQAFEWGEQQRGVATSMGVVGIPQMIVRGSVQEVLERLENARKEK